MSEKGKKIDKILTWAFGAVLVGAIVLMILGIALDKPGLKTTAIVIAIVVCVISFVLDYVLKYIFKEEKNSNKNKKSENEEQVTDENI